MRRNDSNEKMHIAYSRESFVVIKTTIGLMFVNMARKTIDTTCEICIKLTDVDTTAMVLLCVINTRTVLRKFVKISLSISA